MKRISNGSDEKIIHFLKSNELWGGAGSIADQAGVSTGLGREKRRRIEESLVKLGDAQISKGITNPRTQMWVSAFKKWKESNI
ncbi:hypothetical protein [Pelagicoccus sp. SDUM812003]|uniref:hypothetical protein n=1 Tax=Pelagicoccus sp. SDUM812003 TaxID=3041267 RepID=UPI002810521F|nr:hypothetical protein [Pelagicoccus sp. SDUM812003]MDQ8205747.1 hypothetical protein [Pelagicoccus sp. SDUM812003]